MTLAALLRHLGFAAGLAILSAAVVRAMIAARVMDRPDPRKAHDRPTPKGGGVGVVVAFLVGVALLYRYAEFARLADPYFRGVIEASVAIAVVAFLDDLYDWNFSVKLMAQVLAALVAVASGIYVRDYRVPYLGALPIGWLGPPLTVVWVVFATNAMNFIDGLNGLAGGVSLIAAACLACLAATHGGWFAYAAGAAAGGRPGRLPAVQLPPRPHLHGRCRQPVLRLHAGGAGGRRQPVRRRDTVVPAGADAAVGRVVRRGIHPGAPRRGRRAR